MADPGTGPGTAARRGAPWRVAFSVVLAISVYSLFSPDSDLPQGIDVNDKLVHGTLFLALALTGLMAGLRVVPLVVALVVYAGASEVLQTVLPIHRDGDPLDALADLVGVALGTGAALLLRRRSD